MALKYGFFHAHRQEVTEGGVTRIEYDRNYDADDVNKHFEGLVAGTGVYMQSNVNSSGGSMACRLKMGNAAPISQDLPDDYTDEPVMVWDVVIQPGDGLIKHRWFKIDEDYHVYLPINGGTSSKFYQIGLVCDENERTISVRVTDKGGNKSNVIPLGGRVNSKNSIGYEPGTVDGSTEIVPGYIEVAPGVASGSCKVWHLLGTWACPYISHLVLPKGDKSAELFVQQYQDELLEWIDHIREAGGLNTKLDIIKIVYGEDGVAHAVDLDLTYDLYKKQGMVYRPNPLDTIMVYYNGLYLIEGNDYSIESRNRTSGDYSTPAGWHCILHLYNGKSGAHGISVNDVLSIMIIKGQTVDIPDGNNIKY